MLIEFCLPVFNEEKILRENTLKLLEYLQKQSFAFNWKIIIISNGSGDASPNIAAELTDHYSRYLSHITYERPGKGSALKKYCLTSKADILVYMDIDLSASLASLPDLVEPIIQKKADMVIGSRLLPESKIERSFLRELSSQSYNFLSKIILKHNYSDLQCGFKAVSRECFRPISPYLRNKRWFFDTELIAFGNKFGCKIKEIPVDWSENRYDRRKSKVNLLTDSLAFIVNLLVLRFRLNKISQ